MKKIYTVCFLLFFIAIGYSPINAAENISAQKMKTDFIDILLADREKDPNLKMIKTKIVDGFSVTIEIMNVGAHQRRLMEYIELLKAIRNDKNITDSDFRKVDRYVYELKRLGVDTSKPYVIIISIKDKNGEYVNDAFVKLNLGGTIPQSKKLKNTKLLKWYEAGFSFTRKEIYPIELEFTINGKKHKAEFFYNRKKILIDHYLYEMFPD